MEKLLSFCIWLSGSHESVSNDSVKDRFQSASSAEIITGGLVMLMGIIAFIWGTFAVHLVTGSYITAAILGMVYAITVMVANHLMLKKDGTS